MTERLADIGTRIEGIRQLGSVVNAMRGLAAARVQQARAQLVAVDGYAATIAAAIGRALTLAPDAAPVTRRQTARPALVLFCAEQGFAGAFSERVFDAVRADLATAAVFVIGTRGRAVANERSIAPAWNAAMPAHSAGVPKLADRIADALYARIATGEIDRLEVVFGESKPAQCIPVQRHRLFPFDMTRFPPLASTMSPLVNLAPGLLLNELTADYLHAQLCSAALHGFAAENQARMEAMAAAGNQITRQLDLLQATQRRVRQEEITAEIIELAAGETASVHLAF